MVHNIVLVGGPGPGNTHLATAIGVRAREHHRRRVRFISTMELVNALEQEKLVRKPLNSTTKDEVIARPLPFLQRSRT